MPTAVIVFGFVWLAVTIPTVAYKVKQRARQRQAGEELSKETPLRAVVVLLFVGGIFAVGFGPGAFAKHRHEQLMANGQPAEATITRVEETGNVSNHRPQVRVVMNVEPEGAPAFESEQTWIFSVSDTQTYTVGTRVKVFYDPEDTETVAVAGVVAPPAAQPAAR